MLFLNMFKNEEKINKAKISKNEIFRRSISLFSEKGIDNVTMRDLAKACNLSPGAFYYHFKNKDDLILHYYKRSLEGHLTRGEKYLKSSPKKLSTVMKWICEDRFKEFAKHRGMLEPLARRFDMDSPTSIMAPESIEIRQKSVEFFSNVSAYCLGTKAQASRTIGRALWLHHLLIVSFWLQKESKGLLLLEESKKIWRWIPTFLKIPGSKSLLKKIVNSLKRVGVWEEYSIE